MAVATRPVVGHDAWTVSKRAAVSNSRLRLASQGACSRPRRRPRDTARLGRPPESGEQSYEVTRAGNSLATSTLPRGRQLTPIGKGG